MDTPNRFGMGRKEYRPGHPQRSIPPARLFTKALALTGALGLISSGAQAANNIDGYNPMTDPPSNAYSFDFEGCDLAKDRSLDSVYDPSGAVFICTYDTQYPSGGNGDAYEDGNLGKDWEELDEVPHNIQSDSSGAAGPETYRIVIGGDRDIDLADPSKGIGYDRITVFGLNATFSDASCVLTVIGDNQAGDFGIGGADTQTVQVVELTQDADTKCLVETTFRLAIGSSLISGSSNRAFVVAGTGDQSVPIPSDIQPQTLSKNMSAVEDSLINWTLTKVANPIDWNFGNTCNVDVPNSKDVTVDITFTKGATEFGDLTATTAVNANNPSSQTVLYDCTDEVYGDEPDDGLGEILVDTESLDFDLPPGMSMPTIEHILAPGTRDIRNELSCDLYVADLLGGPDVFVGTLAAAYTLPNEDIAPGEVVNESVVVEDTESITLGADRYNFAAVQSGGVSGSFTNYAPGESTTGPVIWASDAQSESGTVQFTKTVTVQRGYDVNGKLEDTARIDLTGVTDVTQSASTSFSTDPKIDLVINKTLGFVVANDTVWDFEVKDSVGNVEANVQITVLAGNSSGSVTVYDLDPDTYTVTETAAANWVATANPLNVALTLPACEGEVSFTNNPATNFFADVEVKKMTDPVGLEDGWTFDLKGTAESGQVVTTDNTFIKFNLDGGENLGADAGTYRISEQAQSGWDLKTPLATSLSIVGCFDTTQNTDSPITGTNYCDFNVAYEQYVGCTFQCTFENIQRGKIIVEKQTTPDNSVQAFEFTGDAAGTIYDDGTIEVDNLAPGTYTSTELVPDGWDLTSILCDDGASATPSSGNTGTAAATFELDPGETVKCTFRNVERGMADVTKTVAGSPPTGEQSFDFELRVGANANSTGTVVASATANAGNYMDIPFTCVASDPDVCVNVSGMAKLPPGDYQFCEANVMPGWMSSIRDFANAFPLPINGSFFVPNQNDPLVDNSIYCAPFTLAAGDTESFTVDNSPPPGGDGRTIGFWKNWTGCDGHGQQDPVLDETLALAPMDYIWIGNVAVDSCEEAILILDKRNSDGRKKASDPCFNAASQMLASELNEVAGARTCQNLADLQSETQGALVEAGFGKIGDEESVEQFDACKLRNKQDADLINLLNTNAGELDDYNNNEPDAVCNN